MNDMEILQKAAELESRGWLPNYRVTGWYAAQLGASKADVDRLIQQLLVEMVRPPGGGAKATYHLTESGRALVALQEERREAEEPEISGEAIRDALDLVVGYDDVKERLAHSLERKTRTHYLFEGPPACAKSIILEGVRKAVPEAAMVFGSQTSAAGLSDLLFTVQPQVLLLDELEKMRYDVFSVLLSLMESGEVIETKSNKTRGIKLDTTVLAACNSTDKLPRELLDRCWHLTFPPYTRAEFVDVCTIALERSDSCPRHISQQLAGWVFDYQLGSVREVRRLWSEMEGPSTEEATRVLDFRLKYSKNATQRRLRREAPTARMAGM